MANPVSPARSVAGTADAPHDIRRLVDLTLLVAEELPCWWSTHMPFQHKTFNYFADRDDTPVPLLCRSVPYQTRWMLMDEHTGTHLDAPAHFIPPPGSGLPHAGEQGLVTVDRVPLEQMAGPIGTDAPSMGSSHDGAPVHVAGLSRGAVFVEALTGLDQLPSRGAFFQFTPIKVARGTGAPGRAVAWLPGTGKGARS